MSSPGVSAGSVAGALYAAGVAPMRIVELFDGRGITDFVKLRPAGGGIFAIDGFRDFLRRNLQPYRNIEDLPIPLYIGVTDFDRGVPAEFHAGALVERIVASCSIPIVFRPVEIGGVRYVDGGVLRNHPAWIIRPLCRTLIGVNVSPLATHVKAGSIMGVAMRTYNLMAKANQKADMEMCDISIETPEIAACRTFDLSMRDKVFMSGYIHTRRALRDAGLWKTSPVATH